MKSKLFLFVLALAALSGCNKLKEAASIDVNTTLQTSIPVTVAGTKALNQAAIASFTKTQDLSLADNTDISSYLSKINSVDLSNIVISISGLTAGQTINTITLDVAGVGTVCTQSNITSSNNQFTPTVSAATLSQLGAKLKADKKLTFTVSGNTSGTMAFVVSCGMSAKFNVSAI